MMRDQADISQDARVMDTMTTNVFEPRTVFQFLTLVQRRASVWTICVPAMSGQNWRLRISCIVLALWRGTAVGNCALLLRDY